VPIRADDSVDTLVTVPRTAFQPATHAPLSQNAELGAELTTQKQITAELRSIQAAMTATQKNAEEKFGELVNQTAETIKLRRELEEERARVRQLEASLRDRSSEAAVPTSATVASDMKW
jgi:peptidoglycan hydrolase CwlO-like protein